MFIEKIILKNFRGYKIAELSDLSEFNAFVGKNDSGKSTILEAIAVFLKLNYKADKEDFYLQNPDEMFVQLNFREFPEILKINDIDYNLTEVGYIHSDGSLKIRRKFNEIGDKGAFLIITSDFEEVKFLNLISKKEKEINNLLDELEISYSKSGRGITNYSKVCKIRENLIERGHKLTDGVIVIPSSDIHKELLKYLPKNLLHVRSREEQDVGGAYIQNYFRETIPIQETCKDEIDKIHSEIENNIESIFYQVHSILNEHLPNQYAEIRPEIIIDHKKIFSVNIVIKDESGIETSFMSRGTGTKRLVTLSLIQHIAESDVNLKKDYSSKMLLLLEEPETYLHPQAQRALASSLKKIAEDPDYQIFITSHSPSVIAEVPLDSISLTQYSAEGCRITREVDYFEIAEELGIRPSDNLFSHDLCIFVEGKTDVEILNHAFNTFFQDRISKEQISKIGIIPTGGNNIHSLVSFKLLHRISKKFIIILDSDKKDANAPIDKQKENVKNYAEMYGGYCHILRKKEIENYVHPEAIIRYMRNNPQIQQSANSIRNISDFTAVKQLLSVLFGVSENKTSIITIPSFKIMSNQEFKETTRYIDTNSREKFEIDEIVELIISCLATE